MKRYRRHNEIGQTLNLGCLCNVNNKSWIKRSRAEKNFPQFKARKVNLVVMRVRALEILCVDEITSERLQNEKRWLKAESGEEEGKAASNGDC